MKRGILTGICLVAILVCSRAAAAQGGTILSEAEAAKVVPSSFYYEGLLASTQMDNTAAIRFGKDRHFIAGMVDTSGYATQIRARYEGFIILDLPLTVGGARLQPGAYGFGFSKDGKLNIYDLSGKQLQSVAAPSDAGIKRPRPLQIVKSGNELRLYRGRNYVVVAAG